jgi:hypothetical protein
MFGQKTRKAAETLENEGPLRPLKEAIRQARIEQAERTGVVVDLRDAELARLELLNDALDPLFSEIPPEVDLFDRGISHSDPPRLWVDVVAHVGMGRDKRTYRFVQDSRFGRKILAESTEIPEVVKAVTQYVARRLVERERAFADESIAISNDDMHRDLRTIWRRHRWRAFRAFAFGLFVGIAALFAAAWLLAMH